MSGITKKQESTGASQEQQFHELGTFSNEILNFVYYYLEVGRSLLLCLLTLHNQSGSTFDSLVVIF